MGFVDRSDRTGRLRSTDGPEVAKARRGRAGQQALSPADKTRGDDVESDIAASTVSMLKNVAAAICIIRAAGARRRQCLTSRPR